MHDFVRKTKLKPKTIFFLQSGSTENVSNIHKWTVQWTVPLSFTIEEDGRLGGSRCTSESRLWSVLRMSSPKAQEQKAIVQVDFHGKVPWRFNLDDTVQLRGSTGPDRAM